MLRAASIGLGWWSDELADAIKDGSDKIRIVTCYSHSADKRADFAQRYGTDQHDSYEAVLADDAIDAVLLTTPHSVHADQVIAAAEAGKHVFVEKPFTLTTESGRRAAQACAQAGRVLAVGHNRRFGAAAQGLKRLHDAGEFGKVLHAEANFSTPGALKYPPDYWRSRRAESPGGSIAALGIHMIDTLTWLFGPIARVSAQAARQAVAVDIDDTTSALFRFEAGTTGYLGTIFACPHTCFLNIYGTEANAFAGIDGDTLTVHRAGGEPEPVALEPIDTLRVELEEFADACDGRADFRVSPGQAIHNVAVMEAIAESAARGAPVDLA